MTFLRTSFIATVATAVLLGFIYASAQNAVAPAPAQTEAQAEVAKVQSKIDHVKAQAGQENTDAALPGKQGHHEGDRRALKIVLKEVVAIVGILMFFGALIAVVTIPLMFGYRKAALQHETLRAMVANGSPIPPELISPRALPKSDLRRGITLVATGLGLALFLILAKGVLNLTGIWAVGFIPGLIGVGHLVVWKLEQARNSNGNGDA